MNTITKYYTTNTDEIKDRLDIVDVIGEDADLQKKGGFYWCRCPLPGHQEKTASFCVDPMKKLFYCFSCHAGGSVIDYVMFRDGLNIRDAMEFLSVKAGIPSSNLSNQDWQHIRAEQRKRNREKEIADNLKTSIKTCEGNLIEAEKRCRLILPTVIGERDLDRPSVTWAIKTLPFIEAILEDWSHADEQGKAELTGSVKAVKLWPF